MLEDASTSELEAVFASRGFRLDMHARQPPRPAAEELRKMSTGERRARLGLLQDPPACWADLCLLDGRVVHPWYSSGADGEEALRAAARRWRTEQGSD